MDMHLGITWTNVACVLSMISLIAHPCARSSGYLSEHISPCSRDWSVKTKRSRLEIFWIFGHKVWQIIHGIKKDMQRRLAIGKTTFSMNYQDHFLHTKEIWINVTSVFCIDKLVHHLGARYLIRGSPALCSQIICYAMNGKGDLICCLSICHPKERHVVN